MTASSIVRATPRLLWSLLWLAACAQSGDAGELALREAGVDPRSAPADETTRVLQRGKLLGGEKLARAITWPTDDMLVGTARDRYDASTRDAIASSPVPVLAPDESFDRATMTVGPHWYALTVHGDDFTMHVDGSGQARSYAHIKAFERTHPMRAGDGFFTRNEGVWSATWIEHGAAYSFEVECEGGERSWCEDEAAVLAKLEQLVYLGGKRVRS